MSKYKFRVGEKVEKTSGDYRFVGEVRAAFSKKNGATRYVVENEDRLLHIFSDGNLEAVEKVEFEEPEEGTL